MVTQIIIAYCKRQSWPVLFETPQFTYWKTTKLTIKVRDFKMLASTEENKEKIEDAKAKVARGDVVEPFDLVDTRFVVQEHITLHKVAFVRVINLAKRNVEIFWPPRINSDIQIVPPRRGNDYESENGEEEGNHMEQEDNDNDEVMEDEEEELEDSLVPNVPEQEEEDLRGELDDVVFENNVNLEEEQNPIASRSPSRSLSRCLSRSPPRTPVRSPARTSPSIPRHSQVPDAGPSQSCSNCRKTVYDSLSRFTAANTAQQKYKNVMQLITADLKAKEENLAQFRAFVGKIVQHIPEKEQQEAFSLLTKKSSVVNY